MVSYLKYFDGFSALDEWPPECWVHVETPTADELVELKNILDLPEVSIRALSGSLYFPNKHVIESKMLRQFDLAQHYRFKKVSFIRIRFYSRLVTPRHIV